MYTIKSVFTKFVLAALVVCFGLAALPMAGASAAGLEAAPSQQAPGTDHPRLERAWRRTQAAWQRQDDRLERADTFIARLQELIDKAAAKGWDASPVQSALDAFASVIPAARDAHEAGAAIITTHSGFDALGEVTDPVVALETVKALGQVLKDTRTAMDGTGQALREAIKAFRQAHPPAQ